MPNNLRQHFPYLLSNPGAAYFDTAASALKPAAVIDRLTQFYSQSYANIHRGAYALSAEATGSFEAVRSQLADFLGAQSANEIVFTRSATESINLVASSYTQLMAPGDVILLTELEHHSNIVPWQIAAKRQQLKLVFAKITAEAQIDWADFAAKCREFQPKVVALTMQSNAFGTVTDLKIFEETLKQNCQERPKILLDACQSVLHQRIAVQELPADFLVFSAHKLYGPSGVGVLWGRAELLNQMPPYQGGGDMIAHVSTAGSSWAQAPSKFEAGTPAIAEVIAFGAALKFLADHVDFAKVQKQDQELTSTALDLLAGYPEVTVYGTKSKDTQSAIISFNLAGVHAHDFATIADGCDLQLRAGFHCAIPALEALNLGSTARISFGLYSEEKDLERLDAAVLKAKKIFKV